MADKTIGELTQATSLNDNDLFVLEQNGTAKKTPMALILDRITQETLNDLVKYDNDEFTSPLPLNADQLNGHPDSYFAKQEDMSAAEQSIAGNTAARHTHANKSILDQITQAMLDLIGTIAGKYSATNPPPYPVTSVNGQTGGIVLNYITFDEEEEQQ